MPEHWGLSGPEFLQLYWIGLALAVLVAIVVRVRVRAGQSTRPVRSLDMDELAFLTGGPRRVVETSIARLLTAGELRTSRRGTVQVTSATRSLNAVDRAVVTDAQRYTNRTVNLMIPAVAEEGVVTGIGRRLEDMGLLVNPDVAKSAVRKGSLALWVLLAIGVARWVNGIVVGAPVGWLTFQLVVTGLLILLLTRRSKKVVRTGTGNSALQAARASNSSKARAGSLDEVVYTGAAGAVLFGGLVVYPDLAVRSSLLASSGSGGYSASSYSAGTHSTCSASSSSCSSGSSGGGGCGGGCGGGGS